MLGCGALVSEPLNRSTFPRAPARGRDRGARAGADARGVGRRAPPRDSRVADGLRPSHDPRPLLPELPGTEDAARRDPIHHPVSRAAHLEDLAGCRRSADDRATRGALGALGTLKSPGVGGSIPPLPTRFFLTAFPPLPQEILRVLPQLLRAALSVTY